MREATRQEREILQRTGVWGDGYTLLKQDLCIGKQSGIIQQWKIRHPIGVPSQVITITDELTLNNQKMPAVLWMNGSDDRYESLRL